MSCCFCHEKLMPKHLASHIVEQHDPKKTLTPSPAGPSTSLREVEISSLAISSTTAMLLAMRGPPAIKPEPPTINQKPPISLTKAPVQKTTCNWCPLEVPIKYKQLHMSQYHIYHREAMMQQVKRQFMPPRPMMQFSKGLQFEPLPQLPDVPTGQRFQLPEMFWTEWPQSRS